MNELKVLDKVRNLLAKTEENGATEAEAQSAFLKAQELLMKHGLSMQDTESYQPELNEIVQAIATTKYDQKYRFLLAGIVAKAFRCEPFKDNATKHIVFIGHKEDVAVCREVYNSAYEFIYREAWASQRKAYAETGTGRGVVNAYALGFTAGLKAAFDTQSKALMVITPPGVTQAKDEICAGGKVTTYSLAVHNNNAANQAYREGKHDGKTFLNGGRVSAAT